jgi:hypothetical protein
MTKKNDNNNGKNNYSKVEKDFADSIQRKKFIPDGKRRIRHRANTSE